MFYLLYKPKGISSFKAITKFKRENDIKKIGHSGTLDPMAQGLLLVATNDDTKLLNYVDKDLKTYLVKMQLGISTNTYDLEGQVTSEKFVSGLSNQKIVETILSFLGKNQQIPPLFSAKKINGKKAYEYARRGIQINLLPISIMINRIFNIKINEGYEITFEVEVSRGTYIRTLVNDIGEKLNVGATMTFLERTKIGDLNLEDCNQEIDFKKITKLEIININDLSLLDNLFNGKEVTFPKHNNSIFAIQSNNYILGIIDRSENQKKNKLFGNVYQKFREQKCK